MATGILPGAAVRVASGRSFQCFGDGDEGRVTWVDHVTLKCGVLFDGHDTEVTVALRYLEALEGEVKQLRQRPPPITTEASRKVQEVQACLKCGARTGASDPYCGYCGARIEAERIQRSARERSSSPRRSPCSPVPSTRKDAASSAENGRQTPIARKQEERLAALEARVLALESRLASTAPTPRHSELSARFQREIEALRQELELKFQEQARRVEEEVVWRSIEKYMTPVLEQLSMEAAARTEEKLTETRCSSFAPAC
ncbi:unnamed protein product [Effrenium voratum]|uniref:Uncharacterized protein n=1 Tax=Effrenium voratum TaxID=2562239 RepID=A0AA36HUP0_9DINO|nr:unnamed protein product [Effrenium voratum]